MKLSFVSVLVALSIYLTPAFSAEKWRILIVAEPDGLALKLGHPAYQRVNNALFGRLSEAGFDLLSSSADANLPNCLSGLCPKLTKPEIISLVKASTLDVDLLVLYSIRYSEQQGAALLARKISVPSRMIDLKTGRLVELWDDDSIKVQSIGKHCKKGCLKERLSNYARQIAQDTGAAISLKLQHYERVFSYQLGFKQFARGELLALERYLKTALKNSQFKQMREEGGGDQRVLFHQLTSKRFEIETAFTPAHFRHTLEKGLDEQGITATIQSDNAKYYLQRTGFPYLARYLGAALGLVILLILLFVLFTYRRHQQRIKQHQLFSQAQQGVAYLNDLRLPFFGKLARWQASEKAFKAAIQEAKLCCSQAIKLSATGDYKAALTQLNNAEKLNSDNPDIAKLRAEVDQHSRASTLLEQAAVQLQTEPTVSAKKLLEAKALNPHLEDRIRPLAQQANDLMRTGLVGKAQQALQLAQPNKPYLALMLANKAIIQLDGIVDMQPEQQALVLTRDDLVSKLTILKGAVNASGDLEKMQLLTADKVQIGRLKQWQAATIGLGYKRLSRLGKQCTLERKGLKFTVCDNGSTNGSWLNSQPLVAGKAIELAEQQLLNMGGDNGQREGLCQLEILNNRANVESIIIKMDSSVLKLTSQTELNQQWPTLQQDAQQTWVLMGKVLLLGLTEQGELDIGALTTTAQIKLCLNRSSWWIEAINNQTNCSIDGQPIIGLVPIIEGADIRLQNKQFKLISAAQ